MTRIVGGWHENSLEVPRSKETYPLEGHKRRHILRGEPVKLEIRK